MRGDAAPSIASETNGGVSTVYAVINQVRDAILEEPDLDYKFPWGSFSLLSYIASTFMKKFATRLFGRCVGALDGISIRIQKPGQLANSLTTVDARVSIGNGISFIVAHTHRTYR